MRLADGFTERSCGFVTNFDYHTPLTGCGLAQAQRAEA